MGGQAKAPEPDTTFSTAYYYPAGHKFHGPTIQISRKSILASSWKRNHRTWPSADFPSVQIGPCCLTRMLSDHLSGEAGGTATVRVKIVRREKRHVGHLTISKPANLDSIAAISRNIID